MISRRAALGTGAGVLALGGAAAYGKQAGKLDDLARTVGVDPKRLPADSDKQLIAAARKEHSVLVQQARATATSHTRFAKALAVVITIAETQLGQLGGELELTAPAPPDSPEAAITTLTQSYNVAAGQRTKDAVEAVSGEFAQVLASISVSASQVVIVLRSARKEFV